ncbi:type IV secretion system protein [Nocardiopsis rhodophaea]|uniref:type IV secretion system protein n=1 Tax=Nocardiopsis rhodophaea TaxID=280238 RepID=UPI0031E0A78A
MALLVLAFVLTPMGTAQANPLCMSAAEPAPQPEAAQSGSDGLLIPPQTESSLKNSPDGLPPDASLYGQYGISGQQWHVIRESCVDKMGSSAVAALSNTAWDLSKTINQSTITVYQAATSDALLLSFNSLVEGFIAELREGLWRPLLPTVIILGAVWLGWYGLIRKRMTLTIESAVWMVLATALGIWILVNPGQIMTYASAVVNSGSQLVNTAVSKVSVPGVSNVCPAGSPEMTKADWESESDFAVRRNSQMLWVGLVCQPWVAGEFGSGPVANTAAGEHGVALLKAQGISRAEQQRIADEEIDPAELIEDKQKQYEEISSSIESNYPEVYPLFEGNQQGSRLGVATLALFASVFAGGLILVGSVALIVLKIGFLLLLLLSPVFLLIGIHPGYGRTVLLRWFEMLLGMLLKQIFVVLLISLLVMCYGLVMGSSLGWGLQMILLALFTLALFIYRKPFAHLFASVNANTFTSRMVSDAVSSNALSKSANVLPPVAYMRAQKWGLKRAPQIAAAASALPAGSGGTPGSDATEGARGTAASEPAEGEGGTVRADTQRARGTAGYGKVRGKAAPPLHLANSSGEGDSGRSQQGASSQRSSAQAPRLHEAASGGLESSRGSSGRSGPIPPRPSGGYTGTGDTGWASVFGTDSGSGSRTASGGSGADSGGSSSGGTDRAAPSTGQGIFRGRSATPPQGNASSKGSRWGGPSTRKDKAAPPPRPPRPAPAARHDEGGTWLSGSKKSSDAPTSPFWAGSAAQRQRENKRDIPFWLRDEDS